MKIIRRGKLRWLISDESITVIDHWQATTYQLFGYPNRKPLELMKKDLLSSKDSEYNNWIEALTLANKYQIRGVGTRYRPEWRKYFESCKSMEKCNEGKEP